MEKRRHFLIYFCFNTFVADNNKNSFDHLLTTEVAFLKQYMNLKTAP